MLITRQSLFGALQGGLVVTRVDGNRWPTGTRNRNTQTIAWLEAGFDCLQFDAIGLHRRGLLANYATNASAQLLNFARSFRTHREGCTEVEARLISLRLQLEHWTAMQLKTALQWC